MNIKSHTSAALLVAAFGVSLAMPAQAEESANKPFVLQTKAEAPSRNQASLMALIGPSYGATNVGVSGVYSIPWLTTGLLNDALYIEIAAQVNHVFWEYGNWTALAALGGLRYEVDIVPNFSLYSAVRSGPDIAISGGRGFGWLFTSHLGGHYTLSDNLSIRAEITGGNRSYYGISGGVTYNF